MKELDSMRTGILCIDCLKGELMRHDCDVLVCSRCGMEFTVVKENEDGSVEVYEYA